MFLENLKCQCCNYIPHVDDVRFDDYELKRCPKCGRLCCPQCLMSSSINIYDLLKSSKNTESYSCSICNNIEPVPWDFLKSLSNKLELKRIKEEEHIFLNQEESSKMED